MKLINCEWNEHTNKYMRTWLADDDSDIAAGFDSESSEGSAIVVVSSGSTYMKNTDGKWQKVGTTEVIE